MPAPRGICSPIARGSRIDLSLSAPKCPGPIAAWEHWIVMVTSSPEDSKSDGLLDTLASPSRPMRHQKPILAALPRLTFVLVAFAAGAEATADSAPTYYFTTAAGRASIGRTD